MRRAQASFAMLAVALFDVALAVAGLAVGTVPVDRSVEDGLFAGALGAAAVAVGLTLWRLQRQSGDLPARIGWERSTEWPPLLRESGRRIAMRRLAATVTMGLLVLSLLLGGAVAVLRSGVEAPVHNPPSRPPIVVKPVSGSGGPLPIVALAVVGGLALVAALALAARRRTAATVAGIGALSTAGLLTVDRLSFDPRFEITPKKIERSTLNIEQPTLLALDRGPPAAAGPRLIVRLQVTVKPPRVTVQLPERRSLTLLSLGGLRVSLGTQQTSVPCGCDDRLPHTP